MKYTNGNWSNFIKENNLRGIEEIPLTYQQIFPNFTHFNKIQSKVFDDVYYTDKPVVVSSPTGSGKTVIFELAIIRLLINAEMDKMQNAFKIVYISPLKALCEERLLDWHKKFRPLGLNCVSVTGDNDNYDIYNLTNYSLIITTPEKWDSLTRKWRNNKALMQKIKLFLVDEVHLLNEDTRGSTLEAVVNRMKIIEDTLKYDQFQGITQVPYKPIRFLAVSATIPNAEDVAQWLGNSMILAKHFTFGEEMRPVPLKKVVLGYPQQKSPFKFDLAMNYRLQSIILQHSGGKPTLIFCNTRKSVEITAKHLLHNISLNLSESQRARIQEAVCSISEHYIKEILKSGIGCHHAGLSFDTRHVIEDLFRNGNLGILVTTSTLALGVNLPAHLVIVKSTKFYSAGEYKDYSESMVLQMIGRAGRPQFDQSGTAVILTTINDKPKYEKLVEGQQAIESNLHKHLTEHINAEVVLKTITDLSVAMQWISSTFLYVRAPKNPRYYGLPIGLNSDQIDRKLLDMCQIEINKLAKAGLLTINQSDIAINTTLSGSLMAKYFIAFETMKLFTQMSGKETIQQVLAILSKCKEFSEIHLRVEEKKILNLLNSGKEEHIRFPLSGRISTSDMKINCIIQAVFGCMPISESSLNTESQKIMRIGERLAKCLAEYLETKENGYSALLSSLTLAKCFHAQLWENSKHVSRQLPGIGNVLSSQLVNAGKTTFASILDANPRDLERIMNKKPPFGGTIQDKVKSFPIYDLSMSKQENDKHIIITINLTLINAKDLTETSIAKPTSFMNLLVGDPNENTIFLYEKYVMSSFLKNPDLKKNVTISTSDEVETVYAHLINDEWVGIDKAAQLVLKKKPQQSTTTVMKKKCPKNTNKHPKSAVQTLMDKYFKKSKQNAKNLREEKNKNKSNLKSKETLTIPDQVKEISSLKTPENTLQNLTLKLGHSKSPKETKKASFSVNQSEENPSTSDDLSIDTLKKTMEKYEKENAEYYNKILDKIRCSPSVITDKFDKPDQSKVNGIKDDSKPSLTRKLSNITLLEERKSINDSSHTDLNSSHNSLYLQEKQSEINDTSNCEISETSLPENANESSGFNNCVQTQQETLKLNLPSQTMSFLSASNSSKRSSQSKFSQQKISVRKDISKPKPRTPLTSALITSNFEFEDSLYNSPPKSNQPLSNILKNSIRTFDKLDHQQLRTGENPVTSTTKNYLVLNSLESNRNEDSRESKSETKCISWKSPLITSPIKKYSPNLARDAVKPESFSFNSSCEIFESSNMNADKEGNQNFPRTASFPKQEQESISNFENANISDFISSSLLETIQALDNRQTSVNVEQNPTNVQETDYFDDSFDWQSFCESSIETPEKRIKFGFSPSPNVVGSGQNHFEERNQDPQKKISSSPVTDNNKDVTFFVETIDLSKNDIENVFPQSSQIQNSLTQSENNFGFKSQDVKYAKNIFSENISNAPDCQKNRHPSERHQLSVTTTANNFGLRIDPQSPRNFRPQEPTVYMKDSLSNNIPNPYFSQNNSYPSQIHNSEEMTAGQINFGLLIEPQNPRNVIAQDPGYLKNAFAENMPYTPNSQIISQPSQHHQRVTTNEGNFGLKIDSQVAQEPSRYLKNSFANDNTSNTHFPQNVSHLSQIHPKEVATGENNLSYFSSQNSRYPDLPVYNYGTIPHYCNRNSCSDYSNPMSRAIIAQEFYSQPIIQRQFHEDIQAHRFPDQPEKNKLIQKFKAEDENFHSVAKMNPPQVHYQGNSNHTYTTDNQFDPNEKYFVKENFNYHTEYRPPSNNSQYQGFRMSMPDKENIPFVFNRNETYNGMKDQEVRGRPFTELGYSVCSPDLPRNEFYQTYVPNNRGRQYEQLFNNPIHNRLLENTNFNTENLEPFGNIRREFSGPFVHNLTRTRPEQNYCFDNSYQSYSTLFRKDM